MMVIDMANDKESGMVRMRQVAWEFKQAPTRMNEIVFPFIFRVSIALLTQTYFQPDEYFQSLEPAHRNVFGYGHLTWEWTSSQPIRSPFYPALFVPVYWIIKQAKLDNTLLLIAGPKIVQGISAGITDVFVLRATRQTIGEKYVSATLFLSLTSFFHVLSLSRTLSNSLETSLTIAALSYWPLAAPIIRRKEFRKALALASIACLVRPTNALLWFFLWCELCWRISGQPQAIWRCVIDATTVGTMALTSLFFLDSWYYGCATFTPLNFFRTNLSSVSLFYGQNPWHYYLSQALPILLTSSLPFFIHGAYLSWQPASPPALRRCFALILWTIAIYSLAGHKEWRFIHPLLPVMHVVAAKSLVDLNLSTVRKWPFYLPIRTKHQVLILLSLPASIYVIFLHGRAQILVVEQIKFRSEKIQSIGFLMPCHSTPWQAYLHLPQLEDKMWALGCDPPIGGQDLTTYKDQTAIFYESPKAYLRARFPLSVDPTFPPSPFPSTPAGTIVQNVESKWSHSWPSHIVLFGALLQEEGVLELLKERGYHEEWAGVNGWEEDEKRRGGVQIWVWVGGTNLHS